jgi:hypothetical protein
MMFFKIVVLDRFMPSSTTTGAECEGLLTPQQKETTAENLAVRPS